MSISQSGMDETVLLKLNSINEKNKRIDVSIMGV
jgi:hypothetical protein